MFQDILKHIRPALVLLLCLTIITGVLYPAMVTGLAKIVFPSQTVGSLLVQDGQIKGSRLIGQPFADSGHFWGRPSATAVHPYNAAASSGSNLGPSNPALIEAVQKRLETLRSVGDSSDKIPMDLVTASASGLDPHISPAAAIFQIGRVAGARNISAQQIQDLVTRCTEGRQLGILGEPRVNVLELNMALDSLIRKGQSQSIEN